MKVYIAHSGHQIDLGPFDSNRVQTSTQQVTNSFLNQSSLLSLKQWIAQQSNISVQNQILLRPNGIKLEDEQSIGEIENETLFVFDRSSFGQSLTVHQQQTYGAVPPKRPTTQELNISEIQYPSLFNSINPDPVLLATARKMYILLKQAEHISLSANNQFELLNRLVQEQKAQAKAVASAYANLNNHSSNVLNSFRQFQQKFSKHEVRFNMLLTSFEDDLNQLGNVELHPKLRSATRQTLLDCVPEKQLRQWAPKCSKELEMFKERIQQGIEIAKSIEKSVETENISSPIVNFKQLSEYVREAAITVQNENQIVDIIMNEYNKLADMITKKKSLASQAASQLIAIHEQNIQKIIQHDQNLQLMVDSCIESKINLTNEMSDRLKGISIIQYNIKMLSRKISTFISITRNILAKFAHLELVHYFPGAYSLALVEILRRRKFLRKYSSEIAKVSNRLTIMREEEQVNRQQFEKYFARFLPPGLIPGLQEKLPANNSLSFMQTTSLLDTSLPSIETPQEIQNVNMSAIRELCGSTLGHGVLKMYATTLDENEMFHQIEYATDPLDDSSFLSFHGVNTRGMLHSRSSSSSSVHAPSYASDNESPSPSPTHSPRSIPSIEQSQKIAHLTKLLSEKETQIEQYEKEREVMKDQLQSSRTTPPNAETTNDLAADSVEKLRDEFAKVERENYKLKETVALKEKLRQEMVHNYEKAMRETQKLKQNTDQYASVLKQISAALVSKTSDSTTKNILNDIVRQLDQPSNSYYSSGNSTGRNNVSLEELVRIVSQLNN